MTEPADGAPFGEGHAQPYLVAPTLLRLARDPHSGHLPRKAVFDVCIRAALFCDLALVGIVHTDGGAPSCADPDGAEEDSVLRALAGAVHDRPGVRWQRWFTHVDADRAAVVDRQLLGSGAWRLRGQPGRQPAYDDQRPNEVAQLRFELSTVREQKRDPSSGREAVLGFLLDMHDNRRTRQLVKTWKQPLASALDLDPSARDAAPTIAAALQGAATSRRARKVLRR